MTPVAITSDYLAEHPLPDHTGGGSKDLRGRVLIVAGSVYVPGAAVLSGIAALRAGAGVLQIATSCSVAAHIGLALPEAMVIGCAETVAGGIAADAFSTLSDKMADIDAMLLGPGMVDEEAVGSLTAKLVARAESTPVVLDAAAITTLDNDAIRNRKGATLLTPHAGEMAKLLGISRDDVEMDMQAAAETAAQLTSATVIMKGARTVIVSPDGGVWRSDHGSSALATSGSGDTLAGVLVGLLARGVAPTTAAVWAVYLHGEAGLRLERRHGHVGSLAREIPHEVPAIMRDLARPALRDG